MNVGKKGEKAWDNGMGERREGLKRDRRNGKNEKGRLGVGGWGSGVGGRGWVNEEQCRRCWGNQRWNNNKVVISLPLTFSPKAQDNAKPPILPHHKQIHLFLIVYVDKNHRRFLILPDCATKQAPSNRGSALWRCLKDPIYSKNNLTTSRFS